jgi:enoyl-CoA hydratase
MNSFKNIQFDSLENIGFLQINRPDKLNALNDETLDEINAVISKVYEDPSVHALIITGSGDKAFVAGADISEIAQLNENTAKEFSLKGQNIFSRIENCHKPVVAAINGFALGGGCELALSCHIRYASENAKLGQPEVSLGITPGYGGTQRLTHLVGKGMAFELMMTGKMISAQEAEKIGLINKVFPDKETLLNATHDLIKSILKNAPLAVGRVIRAGNDALKTGVDGFKTEVEMFTESVNTEDFREGTKAFLDKRKPNFKAK